MKPQKIFQASFVLLLVLMIAALGIEIFFAFFSRTLIQPDHTWLPGEQVLISLNGSHALGNHYIRALEPGAGLTGLFLALTALLILFTAFRKRKRWGWFALLITAGLVWLSILAENLPVQNVFLSVLGILGLFLVIGAMTSSARPVFGKDGLA